MTQSPMDKKSARASVINGACVVLAVVGLGLVSNRLLDMAGIANERGFSVEERKEKAERNNTEYAEMYDAPNLTPASWFSTDKFDCENQRVIEAFKNKMACDVLLQCNLFGFRTLADVASASQSQILKKVEEHRLQNRATMLAPIPNPTEAQLAWVGKQLDKTAEDEKAILLNLPKTFGDFRSINDDFNPAVSKYRCRAQFRYNVDLVRALWDNTLRSQLANDPLTMAVTHEELRKNPQSDHLQFQLDLTMKAKGISAEVEQNAPQTVIFTVQQSRQGDLDIEILKMAFPGG